MIFIIGVLTFAIVLYIANKILPCGNVHEGTECCRRKHKDKSHWGLARKNGTDYQVFWE